MSYEVTIKWVAKDVKWMHPDWVDSYCEFALEQIGGYLESRVIELGNEVLCQLINEWQSDQELEKSNNA